MSAGVCVWWNCVLCVTAQLQHRSSEDWDKVAAVNQQVHGAGGDGCQSVLSALETAVTVSCHSLNSWACSHTRNLRRNVLMFYPLYAFVWLHSPSLTSCELSAIPKGPWSQNFHYTCDIYPPALWLRSTELAVWLPTRRRRLIQVNITCLASKKGQDQLSTPCPEKKRPP